jgi:hypothetical protein
MKADHPLTARRIALVLAQLERKPQNAHDMAVSVSMCVERARNYLMLMERERLAHVRRYELRAAGNEYPVAVYAAGPGVSAPKPGPRTGQQKQAARRARIKADKDAYELMRQRENTRRYTDRVAKKPHGWASALGLP